jgi:hypothetical protein
MEPVDAHGVLKVIAAVSTRLILVPKLAVNAWPSSPSAMLKGLASRATVTGDAAVHPTLPSALALNLLSSAPGVEASASGVAHATIAAAATGMR